jgi:hypothetical protein
LQAAVTPMIIIIIIIKLYLNTVLFHKLLKFNLIMYKKKENKNNVIFQ